MNHLETVGIVGSAGDLGSKLFMQGLHTAHNVCGFDVSGLSPQYERAVDPLLLPLDEGRLPHAVSLNQLVQNCTVLHWCAPVSALETLEILPAQTLLVLHDSVMQNSVEAAEMLQERSCILGGVAIVHCRMNPERTVVINEASDYRERITKHIKLLGLHSVVLSTVENDTLAAQTQGILALLCKTVLPQLKSSHEKGLLPPSGTALYEALTDREARWTSTTLRSLLTNPQLWPLIESMAKILTDTEQ